MKAMRFLTPLLLPALFALSPLVHGALLVSTASLSGAAEDPPNASPGTGSATVTYDGATKTLRVEITFSDLLGPTTVAHIHAPTALPGAGVIGVAVQPGTLTGFPAGVTSGVFDETIDLANPANYTAAFLTLFGGTAAGAEAGLISAILGGKAYVNVHTSLFPAGEIRGFLAPVGSAIPEPGAWAMMAGLGLCGLAAWRRCRQATLPKA